jgi:hypothetical protein
MTSDALLSVGNFSLGEEAQAFKLNINNSITASSVFCFSVCWKIETYTDKNINDIKHNRYIQTEQIILAITASTWQDLAGDSLG